jgi:hypothetical protein
MLKQNKLLERIQGNICGLIQHDKWIVQINHGIYRCIYKMVLCVSFIDMKP